MTDKEQAGLLKRSFQLNYHGGTIWCEHLDSMGSMEEAVIRKLTEDSAAFSRPSVSGFMIINLDETVLTDVILCCIRDTLRDCPKHFRKIAIVGAGRSARKQLCRIHDDTGAVVAFIDDYEMAKEWIFQG